ncbi:Myosin head motor domain [Trinorchestia longiramus]|nr:Myosin head motor domain [Trinorchestia longiramus]
MNFPGMSEKHFKSDGIFDSNELRVEAHESTSPERTSQNSSASPTNKTRAEVPLTNGVARLVSDSSSSSFSSIASASEDLKSTAHNCRKFTVSVPASLSHAPGCESKQNGDLPCSEKPSACRDQVERSQVVCHSSGGEKKTRSKAKNYNSDAEDDGGELVTNFNLEVDRVNGETLKARTQDEIRSSEILFAASRRSTSKAHGKHGESKRLKSVMKDRSPSPKNGMRIPRKVTFMVEPIVEHFTDANEFIGASLPSHEIFPSSRGSLSSLDPSSHGNCHTPKASSHSSMGFYPHEHSLFPIKSRNASPNNCIDVSEEDYRSWKLERQNIEMRIEDVLTRSKEGYLSYSEACPSFQRSFHAVRRNSAPTLTEGSGMPGGWRRPPEEPGGCGSSGDLQNVGGDASTSRYQHQYPHSLHHHHHRQPQFYASGGSSSAAGPPFSTLQQLSSSSAATPSPSSSSSSTPSSARLASRGLRPHSVRGMLGRGSQVSRGLSMQSVSSSNIATSKLGPRSSSQEGRSRAGTWTVLDADEVGVADCSLLSPANEETIVRNLNARYDSDIIYSNVGSDLVSVNPYQRLDLYTQEVMKVYRAPLLSALPPHLFAVGERARRGVYEQREDQVIVLAGESGAGKTEAGRLLLQFLCLEEESSSAARLHAAHTVLEAFGNARTRRNDNASRFAKHVELELDHRGEASRVCHQNSCERNYHIFYQLVTGAHPHTLKSLRLQRSADQYKALSSCRPAPSDADVDKLHYAATKHALDVLGSSATEQHDVMCIVAAVLKFSNLVFSPVNNIDGTEGCAVQNEYEAREACELLQCSPRLLLSALRTRTSVAGSAGECVSTELTASQASTTRDLLCQALYARLFSWLLNRVNEAIKVGEPARRKVLSIVDVFGFEILERNSFSQLIINYTNERLTQVVRQMTLKDRQEEYVREGLEWTFTDPAVEMPSLHLLQQSKSGILALVEDLTSRNCGDQEPFLSKRPPQPQAAPGLHSDAMSLHMEEDLLKHVAKSCVGHPCLDVKTSAGGGSTASRHHHADNNLPVDAFRIRHYAGSVTYSVRGFLAKNKDELSRDLSLAMFSCEHPFLRSLFPEGNPRRGSHKRPASVVSQAQISVASLLRHIAGKKLHVVHCLKPNDSKLPRELDDALLAHQIRYHCLVEICRVSQEGWVMGATHQQFLQRYRLLSEHTWPQWRGSSLEGSAMLLADLSLTPSQYTFGRTRVYIKSQKTVEELEQYRRERLEGLAVMIQAVWRCFVQRRRYSDVRRAQLVIATAWRRHREKRRVEEEALEKLRWGRPQENLGLSAQILEKNMMRFRREDWAAAVVQNAYVRFLRWRFLVNLISDPPSESPIADDWPPAPLLILPLSLALRRLHHLNRCTRYRLRFDQTARNRMREKVTASIIFRERKASYSRSIGHPFVGDYVRLRQNAQWKKVASETNDHYIVFADIVNKITRSAGKFVPILLAVSTNALLVVDQRTLQLKYRIPASDIARISLSPFMDDIAVVHVKPSSPTTDIASGSSQQLNASQGGCLFGSDIAKRKGDIVLQTGHVIEVVTKLFLVVQNATGNPPEIVITTEFETNFGESTVVFSFRTTGLADVAPGHIRIIRRQNRMEVHL